MEVICTFITSTGETVTQSFLAFSPDVEAMKQHLITKCDATKVLCISMPEYNNKILFIADGYTFVKQDTKYKNGNDDIPF